MNLIFSIKLRKLSRQTSFQRAKRFLGSLFPVGTITFHCCLITWGGDVTFFNKLAYDLAKTHSQTDERLVSQKKICPRNPLAIVDGVCLYN